MFSGIVEGTATTMAVKRGHGSLQVKIGKPKSFDDLRIGDSICCSGVCLTIEEFDHESMTFSIGHETLTITQWQPAELASMSWNLERSLRLGDRIHGHLVAGHVEAVGKVTALVDKGDCWLVKVKLPVETHRWVWKKGSITLNGMSLTVNEFSDGEVLLCIVPETIRKTNFRDLKVGDDVNIETDYLMKGMLAHAHATRTD